MAEMPPRPNGPLTQKQVKHMRSQIQYLVHHIQSFEDGSRERSLAITKLQEGKMWLGQELGNLGGEDLNAKRDAEELNTPESEPVNMQSPPETPNTDAGGHQDG